jgi:hypothetical protein
MFGELLRNRKTVRQASRLPISNDGTRWACVHEVGSGTTIKSGPMHYKGLGPLKPVKPNPGIAYAFTTYEDRSTATSEICDFAFDATLCAGFSLEVLSGAFGPVIETDDPIPTSLTLSPLWSQCLDTVVSLTDSLSGDPLLLNIGAADFSALYSAVDILVGEDGPISAIVKTRANEFLQRIEAFAVRPTVLADEDGEITFIWRNAVVISVSLGSESLDCLVLDSGGRIRKSQSFKWRGGTLPRELVSLIPRLDLVAYDSSRSRSGYFVPLSR